MPDNIVIKLKKQCLPHEQYPFPPQLPATHFENGRTSVTRAWQNVKISEQKPRGQWQESTEAVELENFR